MKTILKRGFGYIHNKPGTKMDANVSFVGDGSHRWSKVTQRSTKSEQRRKGCEEGEGGVGGGS